MEKWKSRLPVVGNGLYFVLGLVSTMQILTLFGFSFSTVVTGLVIVYAAAEWYFNRSVSFEYKWIILLVLILDLITTAVALLSGTLLDGYTKRAIMSFVQIVLVLLVAGIQRTDVRKPNYTDWFLRGFDLSCKIQLVWCFAQLVLFKVFQVDLNSTLFGGISAETSQYRNGDLACTGLHWHAANMMPVLVYLYFSMKKNWWKFPVLFIAYETHSATILIAAFGCVGLDVLCNGKQWFFAFKKSKWWQEKKYRRVTLIAAAVALCAVVPVVYKAVAYLVQRIAAAFNPTHGNQSSATHLLYYQSIGSIWKISSFIQVLFGHGMDTSGSLMTVLHGQYPNEVWVVESDVVNILLCQGIAGFMLWYGFLITLGLMAWPRKKQRRWALMLIVLVVCGITYNNQFLWVILVELMVYRRLQQREITLKGSLPYYKKWAVCVKNKLVRKND